VKIVIGGHPGEATLAEWRREFPGVEFVPTTSAEERLAAMPGATAYMGYGLERAAFVAAGSSIRWVHATSAGVERLVNIPELVESDITLTNTRGGHAACIAEHTFAMLLSLTRRLFAAYEDQKERVWDRSGISEGSREVGGGTMVILGMGNIGRAVAKRAVAFDLRVLGVDLYPDGVPDGVESVWGLDRLDEALGQADIVVVTTPITPETRGLIDARRIGLLKPEAYLLVVSRGGIIDEHALVGALKEGRLAGAGLDVQEREPMPADDPLWEAPNLILTPHCSAASRQTSERVWSITRENLRRFLRGEALVNVCDKRAGF
jgi:phosphoglycerate dehydrogenase-like enzyme